ncbi:MAG: MiaB/RimO family radical SAM methylthiotransferase, partial [Synergistaceae bacterium]|nr:MiaB/RimO family radical SAM methylthiotransferase [Synergistaceae bacterium]
MRKYLVAGRTFSIIVFGCRTNHYEGEALASMLEARGALNVPAETGGADIIIAVTCSLTSAADAKARKTLRRLRRENGGAVIVLCGCYAQAAADDVRAMGADILAGSGLKHRIPDALEDFLSTGGFIELRRAMNGSVSASWDALSLDRPRLHTRAFVKVQDGCDRRCSYCAVPGLRGPQISRDPDEIRGETEMIVESGCREVVLTGICLGSYKYGDTTLAKLVSDISRIPGLSRLRFGSLEPYAANDDLLRAISESDVFCPHLHLPLQSGDDGVLAAMRRGYAASDFARILESVRSRLGDETHVSTDLMVGFPGESDEAFENSLTFAQNVGLGRVHVFPFSPREGTRAASMPGQVPRQVVRERTKRAIDISEGLLSSYAKRWVGRGVSVLAEGGHGDF